MVRFSTFLFSHTRSKLILWTKQRVYFGLYLVYFSGHLPRITRRRQTSSDASEPFGKLDFVYFILTHKTGCGSRCVVALAGGHSSDWFSIQQNKPAQPLLSAFVQHVFSLSVTPPICRRFFTRAVTRPIS